MNTYTLGTAVRCSVEFADLAGDPFDPDTVVFRQKAPDDAVTSFTYAVDLELQREDVGKYFIWVPTELSGDYCYRFESGGDVVVAAESTFTVAESCFEEV
jgi:hypothetical protein